MGWVRDGQKPVVEAGRMRLTPERLLRAMRGPVVDEPREEEVDEESKRPEPTARGLLEMVAELGYWWEAMEVRDGEEEVDD